MPRNFGTLTEASFVNGVVTEATGLNFPKDAVSDALNVIFKEDGSIERRLGFDYESDYQLNTVTRNNVAVSEYLWAAAGGSGDVEFVVQQVGTMIYFYRVSDDQGLSKGIHSQTFDLTDFKITGSPAIKNRPCGFTSGKGYLFVTHPFCSSFFISYDTDLDTFTSTVIDIKIRDFEGVEDDLDIDFRPLTETDLHTYNLRNQGWVPPALTTAAAINDPLEYWRDRRADDPSNCDVWWLYKNVDEEMSEGRVDTTFIGNTPAPKGHYILNPFDTNRSTVSGLTGLTEKSSGYNRPSTCSFFAGRIFFSGVNANGYTGEIYYSQIIERDTQIGACHQLTDPTSEHNSDLLPSDGGVIRILDAGQIYRLFSTQKALLVFASNGVWSISGSELNSFSAEDYTIKRVSSIGVDNPLCIVDVLGAPVFWTTEGIWSVQYDNGEFAVQSISDQKVKTYLKNIPRGSIKWVKGAYDPKQNVLQFLYRSTEPDNVNQRYEYDRILCLNSRIGAFYFYSVTSATKYINGIVACEGPVENSYDTVIDGSGNFVIDGSGNPVVVYTGGQDLAFRYFITKNISGDSYSSTWALEYDEAYLDWQIDNEDVNYSSYIFTGFKPVGEGNKEFQDNYVTVYMKDNTNSSAFLQGCWDFANSTSSNKWTIAQQVYNSASTFRDYHIRKIKIRGWGKSLHFKIYSEAGKPFNITGWAGFVSVNPSP